MKNFFHFTNRVADEVMDFRLMAVLFSLLLFLSVFIRVHLWFQGFSLCA